MDFQKPTQSKLKTTLTMFAGMVLGAMASKVVIGVIHKPSTSADPAAIKKDNVMLLAKRVGIAGASAYGAASIKGDDTASTVVKGMLYGSAGQQAVETVAHVVKTNDKIATAVSKSKHLAIATGLACPCSIPTPTLNRPVRIRPKAMRGPGNVYPGLGMSNPLERALEKGRMISAA